MSTTNMNLTLPTVSVTIGPGWANLLNTALTTIDEHDHTSGKGTRVPASGLNINTDLSFGQNSLTNLYSLHLVDQQSSLTGASYVDSVYAVGGNLYFTNSSGVAVQITNGASLASEAGKPTSLETTSISSDATISASDTYVILSVSTAAAREITLPLSDALETGRFYAIKDITGSANTNNITITPSGSDTIDGESSAIIDSNYGALWLYTDGIDKWYIF